MDVAFGDAPTTPGLVVRASSHITDKGVKAHALGAAGTKHTFTDATGTVGSATGPRDDGSGSATVSVTRT